MAKQPSFGESNDSLSQFRAQSNRIIGIFKNPENEHELYLYFNWVTGKCAVFDNTESKDLLIIHQ